MARKPPTFGKRQNAQGAPRVPPVDYCAVAAAAGAVFANSLQGEFVYDDHAAIVNNPDVIASSFSVAHDFWGGPISSKNSHKSWRPLTTLSFRANFLLHGLHPLGFHAVNVLLHVACSLLVLRLAQRMVTNRGARLFAALLFAVHPVHCEPVAGIVGRADLLAALCVLAGLAAETSLPYTCLLTVIGLACKETAIVLPVLLGLRRAIDCRKFSPLLPLALFTLAASFGRLAVQNFEKPDFAFSNNPASHHGSLLVRAMTFLTLPMLHLWLLIWPRVLCFDWSMDAVPLVETPIDHRFILALCGYGMLTTVTLRALRGLGNRSDTVASRLLIALLILVVPHALLASNLLTYVGFVIAERVIYLPSAGFCLLAGIAVEWAANRYPRQSTRLLMLASVILAALSARTLARNEEWSDELKLCESALAVNPAKAYANLGAALARRGRSADAEEAYRRALERHPSSELYYNLGALYAERGNHSTAVEFYTNAIRVRPAFALAHFNLGMALRALGRPEAAAAFAACCKLRATDSKFPVQQRSSITSCSFNLGSLLADQGEHGEAINAFRKALDMAPPAYPSIPALWTALGESYAAIGMEQQAESCYTAALAANPHHSPALVTTAQLRMRQNRSHDARQLLQRAASAAPNSSVVHLHLGLALQRAGSIDRARSEFELAIGCDATNESAHFALANLEREEGRNTLAEQILRRLLALGRTSGVLGQLAAQLHLNQKYAEAEKLYEEALKLDPNDEIARENRVKLRRILAKGRS